MKQQSVIIILLCCWPVASLYAFDTPHTRRDPKKTSTVTYAEKNFARKGLKGMTSLSATTKRERDFKRALISPHGFDRSQYKASFWSYKRKSMSPHGKHVVN